MEIVRPRGNIFGEGGGNALIWISVYVIILHIDIIMKSVQNKLQLFPEVHHHHLSVVMLMLQLIILMLILYPIHFPTCVVYYSHLALH